MSVTGARGRRARLSLEAVAARAHGRLRRGAARRRRAAGEARALDTDWLPAAPAGAAPKPAPGRVLNLLESSLPHVTAGYAQRSRTLCAAQRRCGLSPAVATRLGFPASRGIACDPVETVDGVPHHRLSIPGLRHYTAVPRDRQLQLNVELALELAVDVRPALLWAATPHLNGLVGLALRGRLGVPLVYDVRGFPDLTWLTERGAAGERTGRGHTGAGEPPGPAPDRAARLGAAEARCMFEADAVVTLSETMRAEIVAHGVDGDRVRVLPHAVEVASADLPATGSGEGSRAAAQGHAGGRAGAGAQLRRRLGLDDRLVVGHASTLRRYEGADVLLRAVALARQSRDDVGCLVVGDGPARAELERLADELGIERAVRFAGRVDASDMPAHYAACDILAVPRIAAPVCERVTPLKVFEALAAGRPLVASALAPLEEAAAGAARFVAPGDPAALAHELLALAADPAGRARLGARALEAAALNSSARLDRALRDLVADLGVEVPVAEAAQ